MKLELIATATFGLEAPVRREIEALGYKILRTENGKVTYMGDERAIVRSNLWLRCADRVLLKMGEFEAVEFEELFQHVKALPWEELIPEDGKFTVIGRSVKSTLHSVPACQSIVKKAVVEKLREFHNTEVFPETGAEYTIKVTFLKDRATITVDTSGRGLHKRGYRTSDVSAPIKETLASAMIELSFWNEGRILVDPFCGSGTIPIEAALMGKNTAPGLSRKFASEGWEFIPSGLWKEERKAAFGAIETEKKLRIYAYDIDGRCIKAAEENAKEAGVSECIRFARQDIRSLKALGENGIIITNPPYGKRIGDKRKTEEVYTALRRFYRENTDWSLFIITPDKGIEKAVFGRRADRRRKLYNGNIEVCYYQFHGERK